MFWRIINWYHNCLIYNCRSIIFSSSVILFHFVIIEQSLQINGGGQPFQGVWICITWTYWFSWAPDFLFCDVFPFLLDVHVGQLPDFAHSSVQPTPSLPHVLPAQQPVSHWHVPVLLCHSKGDHGHFAQHKTISFEGCISQIFFLHLFTGTEIVLLISMSFDRCIAICKPLHYSSVMSQSMCVGLVVASWTVGFLHTMTQLAFTLYLPFCGPNVVDSFFCDLPLVIQLACIDTYILGIFMISTSGVIALISFLLLLTSYITVLVTIKDHSSSGSSKALSTCTAHFIVVSMFFGPCIFIYVWPFTNFLMDKTLSIFYTIFTPFLNPLIYTLRNQEVKTAVKKKLSNQYLNIGKTTPMYSVQWTEISWSEI